MRKNRKTVLILDDSSTYLTTDELIKKLQKRLEQEKREEKEKINEKTI